MSRPDRSPGVGVDFAAPKGHGNRSIVMLVLVMVAVAALLVAVTQLLLR